MIGDLELQIINSLHLGEEIEIRSSVLGFGNCQTQWQDENSGLAIQASELGTILSFNRSAEFLVSHKLDVVSYYRSDAVSDAVLTHLLLDQVLPRVLSAKGNLVLHAGSVVFGSQAVCFLGESGRGKSTFTAHCAASGHRLLSDDAVVATKAESTVSVQGTYPSLRLGPEGVRHFFPELAEAPIQFDIAGKGQLVPSCNVETIAEPVKLAAIFDLRRTETDGVTIERVNERDATMALVANSFLLNPADSEAAGRNLAMASRVASTVPLYRLTYPSGFDRLEEVRQEIENLLSRTGDR